MPKDSDLATVAKPEEKGLTVREASALIRHDMEARQDELAKALANRYDPGFFLQVALSQFSRTPELWNASRSSIIRAIIEAAQLGLPFIAGRAWLVPYRNHGVAEAQLIVGYQGLVDLVTGPDTGVTFVEASVVYAADTFRYERGSNASLYHVEARPEFDLSTPQEEIVAKRGPRIAAWARVMYRTGQSRFDVMSWAEIEAIRLRSRAGKSGPWITDYDEMAKKTVLRRLCKTLRISLNAMALLEAEDRWEAEEREQAAARADTNANLRRQIATRLGAEVPTGDPGEAGGANVDNSAAPAAEGVQMPLASEEPGDTMSGPPAE